MTYKKLQEEYDGGIVSPKFGCPQCGNRNMDSLIINDDNDYCRCECGKEYDVFEISRRH